MKFSWEHLIAIGAAVLVVLLAWFSGSWFRLAGVDRAILSIGILVIGAAIIGGFLLWARSKPALKAAPSTEIPSSGAALPGVAATVSPSGSFLTATDIDLLVREAERKVKSARLGHGLKLSSLRQIFAVGEAGSGKTEAVVRSGLDPELLAGQVFQEGAVIPTPAGNFWFARKTVLIEAGPNVLAAPRLWTRLIRRLAPGGLSAAFGGKSQGERGAVVCFDCGNLVSASTAEASLTAARILRSRLEEMSHALGSSFPVYVLFTKADRLPFFDDFVNTLTAEESAQVLGVTLPVATDSPTGVYAERESRRLSAAFNNLFNSLADHRLELLSREPDVTRRAGSYEHPREFNKVSKHVVQFLVELCRPSQLRAGPFLRGFYFTGQRLVAATAPSSNTAVAPREHFVGAAESAGNATTILRREDLPAMPPNWQSGTMIQGATETRKVPQWIFLSHVFSHVLLQDSSALGASGASTRADFWRKILLAAVIFLCFIWICGSLVSYVSNRSLENDLLQAAQAIGGTGSSGQSPTLDSLQRLDALRRAIENLDVSERSGAPWHLRWGLYAGHESDLEARRIYFAHFYRMLLGPIQASMVDALRRLPSSPGPTDEYSPVYDTLKAYLITTSNPDKSTPEFLSPALQKNWTAGQNLDSTAQAVARLQFDFYADQLKIQNPYSSQPDLEAVSRARDYLNHFGALPRIYAAMQNAAAKQNPSLNFYAEHPEAGDLIRSVPEVPGAFTKGGWDFMQNAIAHSDQYFRGEEWVLGGASEAIANRSELEARLRTMYQTDFIKRWQDFLKSARVAAPYGSFDDGVRKLKKFSANESPVLALVCDGSQNTAGRSPDVDKAFGPIQAVAPSPGCENRVPPALVPYLGGLAKLENCFEGWVGAPPDQKEAQRQQCSSAANDGKLVVTTQIVLAMPKDPDGHMDQTVQALLEAPISVPAAPAPTGSGAKALCDKFSAIGSKFPFNPSYDAQDTTIQEFEAFFRPDNGALQQFIQANQAVLVAQGSQFALKPGAKMEGGPQFLSFVNRAHLLQMSLYPAGGGGPAQLQYRFNVRAVLPEGGITGVTFTLNGQPLSYPGAPQTVAFTWPGNGAQGARISYRTGGSQETDLLSQQGPWAIIRLLSVPDAKVSTSGSTLSAEWHPLQADRRTPLTLSGSGKPIVVHLDFDGGAGPFALQGSYFSNLGCRAGR